MSTPYLDLVDPYLDLGGDDHKPEIRPTITAQRGIHFGTVTTPNVGQRPTVGLESSLLWETSMLTVAQSTFRPTAVPKWIPLTAHMRSPSSNPLG
jgi:hypothetical protein